MTTAKKSTKSHRSDTRITIRAGWSHSARGRGRRRLVENAYAVYNYKHPEVLARDAAQCTRVKTGGLFAAAPGHGTSWYARVLLLRRPTDRQRAEDRRPRALGRGSGGARRGPPPPERTSDLRPTVRACVCFRFRIRSFEREKRRSEKQTDAGRNDEPKRQHDGLFSCACSVHHDTLASAAESER